MNDMPELKGLANRDPIKLLIAESRYKPDIAKLIEDIDEISEEYIDSLSQLIWRKEALKKLKRQKIEAKKHEMAFTAASQYANQMGQIQVRGPVTGAILRYIGPELEFKPPKGMMVTIRTGDQIFVSDGDYWLDNIYLGTPNLATETISENATRTEYVDRN